MNSLGRKITVGIAGLASIIGFIMLIMIFLKGDNAIINGQAERLTYSFIYLVVAILFIALFYFLVTGILSLIINPSALKKDALPLIMLAIILILLIWLTGLDINALSNASFINIDVERLTGYFGLSNDQVSDILSWRSWLNTSLIITGVLLVIAILAFVFDMIKSSVK